MAKEEIKSGWKPAQMEGNVHKDALKERLKAAGLTFKGAQKRHSVGADQGTVLMVAAQYWQQHKDLPDKAVTTWAHAAFWELWEER